MTPWLMMLIHNLCLNFTLRVKVCDNDLFEGQEFPVNKPRCVLIPLHIITLAPLLDELGVLPSLLPNLKHRKK